MMPNFSKQSGASETTLRIPPLCSSPSAGVGQLTDPLDVHLLVDSRTLQHALGSFHTCTGLDGAKEQASRVIPYGSAIAGQEHLFVKTRANQTSIPFSRGVGSGKLTQTHAVEGPHLPLATLALGDLSLEKIDEPGRAMTDGSVRESAALLT
ncbi:hypothetical protein BV22DRAFT_597548 [Leucogyrophana mollusca]|uniref:Uncharacterized protein n=1 Tax=Leucogyrophana mollusca TaxID=85980 RepID=A0ACB8BEN2_9AGAM|nr:hypothetical protein BV22DRAFT_597548 [Leucogyrophana mollusca]